MDGRSWSRAHLATTPYDALNRPVQHIEELDQPHFNEISIVLETFVASRRIDAEQEFRKTRQTKLSTARAISTTRASTLLSQQKV